MPPRANANASASTSTMPSDAAAQQKQVTAELGGIEQYELPRAVVTKLARAAVSVGRIVAFKPCLRDYLWDFLGRVQRFRYFFYYDSQLFIGWFLVLYVLTHLRPGT